MRLVPPRDEIDVAIRDLRSRARKTRRPVLGYVMHWTNASPSGRPFRPVVYVESAGGDPLYAGTAAQVAVWVRNEKRKVPRVLEQARVPDEREAIG